MIVDLKEIDKLLNESNLSEVARAVGIPYRTLQAWKLGENKWWADTQDKLTKLQNYVNTEENKMRLNNENILLEENQSYNEFYENKNVKFARLKFAGEDNYTFFENENYQTNEEKASWRRDDGTIYNGIVDANPTGKLAEFSNTEISVDGKNWNAVKDLVEK